MTELENGITKLGCVNHDCEKCKATAGQEPVAFKCGDAIVHIKPPIYGATPPQRTWVGLTDEEFNFITKESFSYQDAIDMTAAKLKEKNT